VPGSGNGAYIAWIYVSCSQSRGTARESGTCPFTIPGNLSPGVYEMRMYRNDGFSLISVSNPFTVTAQ
jgi:hypothetical protein